MYQALLQVRQTEYQKKQRKTQHNSSNKSRILTDACAAAEFPPEWCHFLYDDVILKWCHAFGLLEEFDKTLKRENRMESDIESTG